MGPEHPHFKEAFQVFLLSLLFEWIFGMHNSHLLVKSPQSMWFKSTEVQDLL